MIPLPMLSLFIAEEKLKEGIFTNESQSLSCQWRGHGAVLLIQYFVFQAYDYCTVLDDIL